MIMDRKIYISPSADFVEILTNNVAFMETSNERFDSKDGNMTKEDDRTGDWDNIWGS